MKYPGLRTQKRFTEKIKEKENEQQWKTKLCWWVIRKQNHAWTPTHVTWWMLHVWSFGHSNFNLLYKLNIDLWPLPGKNMVIVFIIRFCVWFWECSLFVKRVKWSNFTNLTLNSVNISYKQLTFSESKKSLPQCFAKKWDEDYSLHLW